MKKLSDYTEEAITTLLKKYNGFFAFSPKQFNEAKKEGLKYVSRGAGLYHEAGKSKEFDKEYSQIISKGIEQDLKENGKEKIIDYVENSKKLIFNSSFKEYEGANNYIKFIKSKFIKPRKNQVNVALFGKNLNIDTSFTLSDFIFDIVSNYYDRATRDIKPMTFIIEDDRQLKAVKEKLISNEILFNDGYESICFSNGIFLKNPIINKKHLQNGKATESLEDISFKLRILSYSNFQQIDSIDCDMVYYFDLEESNKLKDKSSLQIYGLNTKQIKDIFIF